MRFSFSFREIHSVHLPSAVGSFSVEFCSFDNRDCQSVDVSGKFIQAL